MRKTRALAVILLIGIIGLALAAPVQAHAMFTRSVPEANAMLSTPPTRVELWFSEVIANNLSSIKVMDGNGKEYTSSRAQVDPADATHLVVALSPLNDGVYQVVWNVISAADGHQTSGSFPFAVGKVDSSAMSLAGSAMGSTPPPTPWIDMLIKGVLFLAATALTGGLLFSRLVWTPAYRQAQVPPGELASYDAFSARLAQISLVVMGVADVVSLTAQAGHASGALVAGPWQPEFLALLGTRIGLLGMARLALVLAIGGVLLPRSNAWSRWAAAGLSLLLLLTLSLESHAAGEASPWLPIAADWIHTTAMSVWVGGLFSFLGGMWLIRRLDCEACTRLTSFLIPHFTALAMSSVAALALTGIYASVLHIQTLSALQGTVYGQALMLKLLIIAPMLAMGAINFLFTTPRMHRAAAQPGGDLALVNRFRRLLAGEAVLGVMVLLWVGVFTTLPPATMPSPMIGYSHTTRADDLNITLAVDPARPGINTFTATIKSGGKPVVEAKDVSLEFISTSGKVPASKAAMVNQGNGVYQLQGGFLSMADTWDIKVVVIRSGKFDAYGDFRVTINQTSDQMQGMP